LKKRLDRLLLFFYIFEIMPKKLTPEAYEKLKKELEYLKTEGRREIAERLRHTASFGDLSENFAYQQAKEDQGFLERRIAQLESILSDAVIITRVRNKKVVNIGSVVTILFDDKEQKLQIVEPEEANPTEEKISFKSPLGQAILGKKVGDEAIVETPNGKIKCKILKIE
jgi:transcription elongation factor GreA